jgi:hypothetical protein
MKNSWEVKIAFVLVAASAVVYAIHYMIFHDVYNIAFYFVSNIAFLFIEVLIVSMVIHRVLIYRERKERSEKLNMVIGAFYSEIGTELLTYVSDHDPTLEDISREMKISDKWTDDEFESVRKKISKHAYTVNMDASDLSHLRDLLSAKRGFMVRLLENPMLLENEAFTDLLMAVFHLTEELSARKDIKNIPGTDKDHLVKDVSRAYGRLADQWIAYMGHLKRNYPYLYSLAIRTNPFDEKASPIVR